jgi:hypothetical protein
VRLTSVSSCPLVLPIRRSTERQADSPRFSSRSLTDFAGQILGPYPIIAGWLPRARGAMAGCVLSALVGMAAVVWYSWGSLNEAEIEAEEQRRHEQKMADKAEGKKHGVLGLAQKVVGGGKK